MCMNQENRNQERSLNRKREAEVEKNKEELPLVVCASALSMP